MTENKVFRSCIDAHLHTLAITLCAADYTCNRTSILEVSQPSNCVSCQSTPETQVSMATVVKSIIAPDILNTKKMWFLVHIRFFFFPPCCNLITVFWLRKFVLTYMIKKEIGKIIKSWHGQDFNYHISQVFQRAFLWFVKQCGKRKPVCSYTELLPGWDSLSPPRQIKKIFVCLPCPINDAEWPHSLALLLYLRWDTMHEGERRRAWQSELCTISEAEWTAEGDGARQVDFFEN